MTLLDKLNDLPGMSALIVYGEPHTTPDGSTVITVTNYATVLGPRPMGVFVVHGGEVKWEPAVDAGRIAILGVLTGLVAATLATAAVLRRPPWPDTVIRIWKHS
ncbi:hypothetical protein [Nocardia sp. NPDC020380]|uniref:hypothetical protein n=1 Tax=Nocardia sp. NPDC020380 TaxID=3364309 RepID=UPI0037BD36F0